MLLQAGLFDDAPKAREVLYNFMRLRALRVEVDVKLATDAFTIDEARQAQGEAFDLHAFHDFVWKNGNVPIALQQGEYLAPPP